MDDTRPDTYSRRIGGVLVAMACVFGLGFVLARMGAPNWMEIFLSVLMMTAAVGWLVVDGIRFHNRWLIVVGCLLGVALLVQLIGGTDRHEFFGVAALSVLAAGMPSLRERDRTGRPR